MAAPKGLVESPAPRATAWSARLGRGGLTRFATAGAGRGRRRAVSRGMLAAQLLLLLAAFIAFATDGEALVGLVVIPLAALAVAAHGLRDTPRDRRLGLAIAAIEAALALAVALSLAPDAWYAGLSFALPAVLVG